MGMDFGGYLKALRVSKQVTLNQFAHSINLSVNTVRNIENGYNPPPGDNRLRLWLKILGCSGKFKEASAFRRSIKGSRSINYPFRHPANEHIDRIIDALESNRLSKGDLNLLRMVAPKEYEPGHRKKSKKRKPRS